MAVVTCQMMMETEKMAEYFPPCKAYDGDTVAIETAHILADIRKDEEECEKAVQKVLEVIGCVRVSLLADHPESEPWPESEYDCPRGPSLTLLKYVKRIVSYLKFKFRTGAETKLFYLMLYRAAENYGLWPRNQHKIVFMTLAMIHKTQEDTPYNNRALATIGGISLKEFNELEWKLLNDLDWFVNCG